MLDSADASTSSFTIRIAGVDERVVASPGVWRKGTITVRGTPDPIAASGAWTADGAYTLAIVRYRTPFATTYRLRFSDAELVVDSEQNVGPADTRTAHIVGRASQATSGLQE